MSMNPTVSDFTSPIVLVNKMDSTSLETKAFGHKLSDSEDPLEAHSVSESLSLEQFREPRQLIMPMQQLFMSYKGSKCNQETVAWLNGKEKHRLRSAEFRRSKRIRAVESNRT
ncbi:hypothetical protein V6N13_136183 [Hibiscus sabdariffa]|uniref:Uncharacterized protein n=1 Tax=Hibiscus sabdariffa TaxID=183260 RepID=A0ABR2DPU5_9ROSI